MARTMFLSITPVAVVLHTTIALYGPTTLRVGTRQRHGSLPERLSRETLVEALEKSQDLADCDAALAESGDNFSC